MTHSTNEKLVVYAPLWFFKVCLLMMSLPVVAVSFGTMIAVKREDSHLIIPLFVVCLVVMQIGIFGYNIVARKRAKESAIRITKYLKDNYSLSTNQDDLVKLCYPSKANTKNEITAESVKTGVTKTFTLHFSEDGTKVHPLKSRQRPALSQDKRLSQGNRSLKKAV